MPEILLTARDLKPALTGLAKVVSRKSTLPILQHVRITRENDQVTLQATDLDVWATYRIQQPGESASFLVPFEKLHQIVKALKGEAVITLDQAKTSRLIYSVGSSQVEVRLEALKDEWPPEPKVEGTGQILPTSFKTTFKEAIECASTDSSRYVINGVCLDVQGKDGHYVISTDGRHLFAGNSFQFTLPAPVIVPVSRFVQWSGFVLDGDWRLNTARIKDVPWLKFTSDQWSLTAKQVDGNYPNWRQVIPKPDPGWTRIQLPAQEIESLLKNIPLLPGNDDQNRTVKIEVTADCVLFKARAKDAKDWTSIRVQDARVVGKPVESSLNREYLLKAMRFGLLDLAILDPLSPLLFQATGKQMVVMPVRPEAMAQKPPQPQPDKPSPPTPSAKPETVERKTMPREEAQETSPTKTAISQIDAIKETLKNVIRDLASVTDALKLAEKEKKTTDKEIESIRAKLRDIQNVKI